MANRIVYEIELTGIDESSREIGRLQRNLTQLTTRRNELNRATRRGITLTEEEERELGQLNTTIAATRNRMRDLERQTLRNNNALRQNSGFVAGVRKGMTEWAGSMLKGAGVVTAIALVTRGLQEVGKAAINNSESIINAFNRVADAKILDDLREATKGTVADLELMRQAVRASNFQIPLERMATLFEFARRRAAETGESVDHLVESIISGIGRKSPLILDNLGISASRLKEELGGAALQSAEIGRVTEIVGKIADEELKKMGDEVNSTGLAWAQLTTSVTNFRNVLGEMARSGGVLDAVLTKTAEFIDYLSGKDVDISNNFLTAIFGPGLTFGIRQITKSFNKEVTEFEKALNGLNKRLKSYKVPAEFEKEIASIGQVVLNNANTNDKAFLLQRKQLFEESVAAYADFLATQTTLTERDTGVALQQLAFLAQQSKQLMKDAGLSSITVSNSVEEATLKLQQRIKDLTDTFNGKAPDAVFEQDNILSKYEKAIDDLLAGIQRTKAELIELDRIAESTLIDPAEEDVQEPGTPFDDDAERLANDRLAYLKRIKSEGTQLNREQSLELIQLQNQQNQAMLHSMGTFTAGLSQMFGNSAEAQKGFALAQVAFNTASAISQSIANATLSAEGTGPAAIFTQPTFIAQLVATVVGAMGQATAIINSTPTTFADGGIVNGPSHANGGVKFAVGGTVNELEGGEAVINKRSTRMFSPILSAINSFNGFGKKFEQGGILGPDLPAPNIRTLTSTIAGVQAESAARVSNSMKNMKVVNVESETTRFRNSYRNTEQGARI